jgi:hypothetical protein
MAKNESTRKETLRATWTKTETESNNTEMSESEIKHVERAGNR